MKTQLSVFDKQMKKKIFSLTCFIVVCFLSIMVNLWALEEKSEQGNLPVYTVHYAKGNIVVDGKLDEKDWELAPSLTFIFPWPEQPGKKQKTQAKLLWDKENLYVAYVCEDTDITAQYTRHDDPVYKDDCVEIFINPTPGKSNCYYGLEMNARSVLYEYFKIHGVCLIKRLDFEEVLLRTSIDGTLNKRGDKDKGWILELAIPFSNFRELTKTLPPNPGSSWRINLNRWDGKEKRCLSQWSASDASGPNPHRPHCFGIIIFSKKE